MNLYEACPTLENERFLCRPVREEDCDALLRVYSDLLALPFFNSDNCDGDNFYYPTRQKMEEVLGFWKMAYENAWFARLSIADKLSGEVIGTAELCTRVSDDEYNGKGILRVDVRSGCEKEAILYSLFSLLAPAMPELMGCSGVITKGPVYAVERRKALRKAGFRPSAACLMDKNGYPCNGYWIR